MRFEDYLATCLKDPLFKKYWEEDLRKLNLNLDFKIEESISAVEALELLEKENLDDIIKNKGIKKNINIITEIIFFEDNDKCPVCNFLSNIEDIKLKEKTLLNISQLAIKGNEARYPLSRYIKDGIFELRTKHSSNITRIFYFFIFGNKIVMTNGYIKKQEKIDEKEFNKAKKYMEKYLRKVNKREDKHE